MKYSQLFCFLLIFLSFQPTFSATRLCSREQGAALFQFKTLFSINKNASNAYNCEDRSYAKTNSWKKKTDCCLWDGVRCDNITGQVNSLDLSCSWLSGTFPPNNTLFLLSHLQSLDLSSNDFKKSKISSQFGHFWSLTHLDLSNSFFSGQVPHEISYLSKLLFLDLSSDSIIGQASEPLLKLEKSTLNRIVGNFTEVREIHLDGIDMSSVEPNSFMNLSYSLTFLSLVGCDLRGNFPEKVFNLPNVEYIEVSQNPGLTGHLPRSNWSNPLQTLGLSMTSFYGELPESIGNLKSLVGLSLVACNFSGVIPTSLGLLPQLSFLFLPFNKFNGNIPSSLASLSNLAILALDNNQLEGYIPDQLNAFPNLGSLGLSNNLLNGKLPSWLYNHQSLISLDLSNNQFEGHINEFHHSVLYMVNFKNNSFQGPIPTSISKLVNLTFLDLSSNNLTGTLSWDIFSKLQRLTLLDLSANALTLVSSNSSFNFILPNLEYVTLASCNISEFPHFLQGSKVLTSMDLSNNRIHGKIAKFPWKNIEFLDLHSNSLQGILPVLPRNIRFFSVSNNNMTGEISTVCNMKFVEILDMSQNNFNGTIPPCVGSFSKSLSSLNLNTNKFHGIISSSFMQGCGLKNLNLNGNLLEGPLTRSISNCKELEVLDLGNNMINDEFPRWIELLPELQVLVLRSNMFKGSINASKNPQSLAKLRIIDLSHNNFYGPLPVEYIRNFNGMQKLDKGKAAHYMGERYSYVYSVSLVVKGLEVELLKILTIFTSIDLSSNNFEGEIPGILGGLSSLRGLNLSHNNLYGHIPPSIGNLTELEWLDLSSDKLDGIIPSELMDLTFLSSFNVSYNELVGPIPQGKQFNTFDNDSYKGNEGLCGLPLSRGCSNNQPPPPQSMKMHQHSGPKIEFGWEVVLIGYGFGFIFGAVIGYFRLRLRLRNVK